MALCTIANWAFNFLVSFTFLSLIGLLGRSGTFLLYAAVGLMALTFFGRACRKRTAAVSRRSNNNLYASAAARIGLGAILQLVGQPWPAI